MRKRAAWLTWLWRTQVAVFALGIIYIAGIGPAIRNLPEKTYLAVYEPFFGRPMPHCVQWPLACYMARWAECRWAQVYYDEKNGIFPYPSYCGVAAEAEN